MMTLTTPSAPMRTTTFALPSLSLAACLLVTATALQAQTHDFAPYMIADHVEEAALARSAAPAMIADSASVYVLTDAGYVEVARGSNGFTCMVIRSFIMPDADSATTWEPRLRAPHCFNAEASRTAIPNILYRTRQMLRGTPAARIEAYVRQSYATHRWPTTTVGAMAYMFSPRQWLAPENSTWKPHLMFFFPAGRSPATWGAVHAMNASLIDAGPAPFLPGKFVLVPVEQWSDGTPYESAGAGEHQH